MPAELDNAETQKLRLREKSIFPPWDQRLFFATRELEEGRTLNEYNIKN